jgi:hypothetical protein
MAEPQTESLGTIYRVIYADGERAFFTPEDSSRELTANQDPSRVAEHHIMDSAVFHDAHFERHYGGWWMLTGLSAEGRRVDLTDTTEPEISTLTLSPAVARQLGLSSDHGDFDAHDDPGTVYRVLYQDGTTALFTALDYQQELREAQDPTRLPQRQIVGTARFGMAAWDREFRGQFYEEDVWVLTGVTAAGNRIVLAEATDPEVGTLPADFDPHYDPETGTASMQAEYGDRTDLGDASAAAPVERGRMQELADRVRQWFQRDRDQGMGL